MTARRPEPATQTPAASPPSEPVAVPGVSARRAASAGARLRRQFAGRIAGIPGSVIDSSTSLLARQQHDIVSFAIGSPAPEMVPSALFGERAAEVWSSAPGAFDYGATEGEPELRAQLEGLAAQRGERSAPERLLITAGGMQGLDLAAKLFVDPGDVVVIESPTYTNATAVITGYGGTLLEVPTDDDGMVVDALAELADPRRPPKMIYVIPNFQNPAGVTMSLARRREVLDLAACWEAVVLEDDPYRLLRFSGAELPSLEQLAPPEVRVIGVHTFSKIIAPGLRVGWVTADREVIDRMIDAKQGLDTCTNVPMQRLVADFMARGLLDDHLLALRREYRIRKDAMRAALSGAFAGLPVSWSDPEGGFFLWLTLPRTIDAERLFPEALERGVAYIPGNAFSPGDRFPNALRLCFGSSDGERMQLGIQRLRGVLEDRLLMPSAPHNPKE